jgi:hypothetical protein
VIDSGAFPASPATPGQGVSRAAWGAIQARDDKPAWWQDYLAIREAFPHFRNWRIWVYIAWAGQPAGSRDPATIEEFAPQVLGCSSRSVRNWQAKTWGDALATVDEAIAWVQAAPLLRLRREIYEALGKSAIIVGREGHQDRKLALEMLGDYKNKGEVEVKAPQLPEFLKQALERAYAE